MSFSSKIDKLIGSGILLRRLSTFKQTKIDWSKAVINVIDCWQRHGNAYVDAYTKKLYPAINTFLNYARDRGAQIIHEPSNASTTFSNYSSQTKANGSFNTNDLVDFKPFYYSGNDWYGSSLGKDTTSMTFAGKPDDSKFSNQREQTNLIQINEKDILTDDTLYPYRYYKDNNCKHFFIVGIHLNMCLMFKRAGVFCACRNGIEPIIIRNLTNITPVQSSKTGVHSAKLYEDYYSLFAYAINFAEFAGAYTVNSKDIDESLAFKNDPINTTLKETYDTEYNNGSISDVNWDSSYNVPGDIHNYIDMSYSELCALTNVLIDFSKETGSDNSMGAIDYRYGIR